MWRQVGPAWVEEGALLDEGVGLEPGAVVGAGVKLGRDCFVGANAVIYGPSTFGARNRIHACAVLGGPPQDLSYKGEPTRLEVGDDNTFREGVTVSRASTKQDWVTRIGSRNFFMAASHVGHDCVVGNDVILANGVLLAGHCVLEDRVNFAGGVPVSQFLRIGRLVYCTGCSGFRTDAPPFMVYEGAPAVPIAVNVIGCRRAGVSEESIRQLREAHKAIFRNERLAFPAAVAEVEAWPDACAEVKELCAFMRRSFEAKQGRGLARKR